MNFNKKTKNTAYKIASVITALMLVTVAFLCTSPSKAMDSGLPDVDPETEPVFTEYTGNAWDDTEPETETDVISTTVEETSAPDTDEDTDETETAEPVTETETDAETAKAATTTASEADGDKMPEGKQDYMPFGQRVFGEHETLIGDYITDRVYIVVSHVSYGNVSFYICDIRLKDVYAFHTAFASGSISKRAYTSKTAKQVGAALAVNGDFCGFRSTGIIIREGTLYRNRKSGWDIGYINKYGDLIVGKNDKYDGNILVNEGVWQSFCFGPALVDNYTALKRGNFNSPDLSQSAREPRTAIGQVDTLHYIILVVDAVRDKKTVGWTTVGGMSFEELAKTFETLGCKTAYNLDGGGSTTLYFKGQIVNEPTMGGERQVSDIIYFK